MKVKRRDDLEKLAPALRRFAHALTAGEPLCQSAPQSPGMADTLVQDALRRGLDLHVGRWPNGLRLFLYSAIIAANRQRLQAQSHTPPGGASLAPQGMSPPAAAHALVHASRAGSPIVAALHSLPLEEREALLLVGLEHLTHPEACEVLRLTHPALLTSLVRARQRVSAHMGTALRLARGTQGGAEHADGPHPGHAGPTGHLRVVK